MAWDWVAPVCAAGGAVLGAGVGAMTTWLTGKGAREHAERLARTERQQQRLADAYIELLEMLQHLGQWVVSVQPFIDFGEPKHPTPPAEQQARVLALVAAYGSPELRKLFDAYRHNIAAIRSVDQKITMAQTSKEYGLNEPDLRLELIQTLRPAEQKLREQISNLVASELQSTENR
jgi:hypothetical protein